MDRSALLLCSIFYILVAISTIGIMLPYRANSVIRRQSKFLAQDARSKIILLAAGISIVYGLAFALLLYQVGFLKSSWSFLPIGLILSLLNPIIGRLLVLIELSICNSVDRTFGFPKQTKIRVDSEGLFSSNTWEKRTVKGFGSQWGSWTPNEQIWFAANWFFTSPLILIASSIALLFGIVFKDLNESEVDQQP